MELRHLLRTCYEWRPIDTFGVSLGRGKKDVGSRSTKVYWWGKPVTTATIVELKARATFFHSQLDGAAFFEWLRSCHVS